MANIGDIVALTINSINQAIPENIQPYAGLLAMILAIVVYAMIVWKFYRFLSRRDILRLNLEQYNNVEHPIVNKVFAVFLYIVEYIIIMPILVFFWFIVMAVFLLVLAQESNVESILLISAGIVGAVRVTAYYSEDLSKDIAKLFPLTLLVIALVTPGFVSSFGQSISKLSEINSLADNILFYLIIIIAIELFMRILYLIVPAKDADKEE